MLTDLLAYDFVQRAFAASGIVAVVAGTVGYFLVLRGQTFAGHALSHVGFAGATGAALIGLPPLGGMVVFTVGAGLAMGLLGERLSSRDVAIGIVLALALGLGFLFLNLHASNAAQATTLLFGNVLAVSPAKLLTLALLAVVALLALGAISRPLLFASLQPELAEAKGVSIRLTGTLFMIVVALAVAQSVQIVGVLLIFALMVGPPAAAQLLTTRLVPGLLLAAGLAAAQTWLGIVIAFHTDWPTSFCITALGTVAYLAALAASRSQNR